MPVFVCHRHLLYNLLVVLVSRFNSAIHLGPVGRRVMMLYLELFTQLSDHCVVDIYTIFSDNSLWQTILMPDKPCHNVLGNSIKRGSFYPLREVINGHQDEAMPIGSSRSDFYDHVNAPHRKGPRSRQDIQRDRRHMHLIA